MGKDLNGKELGAGIYQRKNLSYCARYIDRFGARKTIYDKNLKVLIRKYNDALYENEHEINLIDDKIILDEWNKKWMDIYKIPTIRPNTKRHYEHIYNKHIAPTLGSLKITEITQLQVKALINKLDETGYQWETQNKVRVILTDMFNRAMEDNFARRNPIKGIRLAKNKPDERRVLTLDEQRDFLECSAGTFYNNFFIVALNSGLRPGELFALTERDIDFEKMEINVDKTLVYQKLDGDEQKEFHIGPPKTKQSVREVPINAQCEVYLRKQLMQKKIIANRAIKKTLYKDFLFTTKYNTPMNSVLLSEAIERIVNEINLMRDNLEKMELFSGHTFRHTFATRCIEAEIQPKILQKYLGHATLQMTMDLYVHVTDAYKQSEMKKLEIGYNDTPEISMEELVNEKVTTIHGTQKM